VRSFTDAFAAHRTGGVYLNFTSDTTTDRVRAGYNDATYDRLVALKKGYDPDNVFRFNQNIGPLGDEQLTR
jgi:FAD/FMN-containing dehydrogenase